MNDSAGAPLTKVLIFLPLQGIVLAGDGYRGKTSPHTPNERFEGATVLKALKVQRGLLLRDLHVPVSYLDPSSGPHPLVGKETEAHEGRVAGGEFVVPGAFTGHWFTTSSFKGT